MACIHRCEDAALAQSLLATRGPPQPPQTRKLHSPCAALTEGLHGCLSDMFGVNVQPTAHTTVVQCTSNRNIPVFAHTDLQTH